MDGIDIANGVVLIVEGDGDLSITPDSLHVQVLDEEVELPAELAVWRAEVEEVEERARLEGDRVPVWNGSRYAQWNAPRPRRSAASSAVTP
ncbi:hypothetical protein ACFWM0_13990 [Streptomyces sp. NPDC058405]|uniref:hypothetical protein n=1 Tax=unclassified Streptomyces TaxID=2593676 RepID=UPI003649BBFD